MNLYRPSLIDPTHSDKVTVHWASARVARGHKVPGPSWGQMGESGLTVGSRLQTRRVAQDPARPRLRMEARGPTTEAAHS